MLNAMFKRDPVTSTTYYPAKTNWDDLRFPISGLKVPSVATAPGIDLDDGMALFETGKTTLVTGFAQIPHDWWEGRPMKPHVHFECMTDQPGNISMQLDYKIADIKGLYPEIWDTFSVVIPANLTPNLHDIFGSGSLPLTGYHLSAGIKFRIWRQGTFAVGPFADTYLGDWKLLEYDLHYERDKVGSGLEYSI